MLVKKIYFDDYYLENGFLETFCYEQMTMVLT